MSVHNLFNIGDHVVIGAEFPNRMLQNQTGTIMDIPNQDHVNEYLVRLDGDITQSAFFSRRSEWVASNFLNKLQ